MRIPFGTVAAAQARQMWLQNKEAFSRMNGMGDADTDRGREILGQFYSSLQELYGVTDSFDNFLATNGFSPGFIEGLGLGANAAGMSYAATGQAMAALAAQGHGMIPKNKSVFSDFLINQATVISSWDAIKYTVSETAKDVEAGVEAGGQTLVETGKAAAATASLSAKIIQMAPILGVALVGYLVFKAAKKDVRLW